MNMKKCTKCGEVKPLDEFHAHKRHKDGKHNHCKYCAAVSRKKYYAEHKEKVAEQVKKWARENKEKKYNSMKKWREENREYFKKWREENKEYFKKWAQANKDKCRLSCQRRRARKKSLPDTLTIDEKADILERFNNACAISGETEDIHLDHFIPLSWSVGPGTVYGNMAPLSASINISKNDRNPFVWISSYPEYRERFVSLVAYLAELNGMTAAEYEDYVQWCYDNREELIRDDIEEDEKETPYLVAQRKAEERQDEIATLFFEGLSLKEIAEKLNVSLPSVRHVERTVVVNPVKHQAAQTTEADAI